MANAFRFNFFEENEVTKEGAGVEMNNNHTCAAGRLFLPKKLAKIDSEQIQEIKLQCSTDLNVKIIRHPDPIEAGLDVAADKDVITDVYEGGFKIWECAIYLLQFLNETNVNFSRKNVVELGCGAGVDGIFAIIKGASRVVFQDFNREVVESWTIPNVLINKGESKTEFFYGDWGALAADNDFVSKKYDIILMSETIYVTSSYLKLKSLLAKCLRRPDGVAYMAAKSYYFCTGGSVIEFVKFLQNVHPGDHHLFSVKTEVEIKQGVHCAICSIRWQ